MYELYEAVGYAVLAVAIVYLGFVAICVILDP